MFSSIPISPIQFFDALISPYAVFSLACVWLLLWIENHNYYIKKTYQIPKLYLSCAHLFTLNFNLNLAISTNVMTAIAIMIMSAPTAPRIATTELLEAESCDL